MKNSCFFTVAFAATCLSGANDLNTAVVRGPDAARVAEIAQFMQERPAWTEPLPAARPAKARALLAQPIPDCTDELYLLTTRTGNRTEYQKVYFDRQAMLRELCAAERVERKGAYLARIEELLEAFCAMRSWVMPAHDLKLVNFNGAGITVDLGSSGIAFLMAEALAEVGDGLPPELRTRVLAEVERRVLAPYRASNAVSGEGRGADAGRCWWFFGRSNWNAVCHANVVRAALAVVEGRAGRAAFVEAAERAQRFFLESFLPDGYCSEGGGYWNYGYGHFLELSRAVRAATGGKVDFTRMPRAKEAMLYGFSYRICGDICPVFADGGADAPSRKWLELGAEFWPEMKPMLDAELPPRTVFRNAQVYILRSPVFAIGAKGGTNAELHNHNDIGSYTLTCDGVEVAGDPGGEVYTRFTFSSKRYESKVLNSYGHPVPVVAGGLQMTGALAHAEVVGTRFGEWRDELVYDISKGYAAKPKKLLRKFELDRAAGRAAVSDEVEFDAPSEFESAFVTCSKAELDADGNTLHLTAQSGGRAVRVKVHVEATGGEWRMAEERIDNPGRRSPLRFAVRFLKPVASASVRFVFSRE